VLVAAASGEFGRSMGGTVNAVTRSGSNSIHGAGYGYIAKPTMSASERSRRDGPCSRSRTSTAAAWRAAIPRQDFFFLNAKF